MIFRLMAVVFLFLALLLASPASGFAQALNTSDDPPAKPDDRTAQALFEDANGYLGRRYQEFNKKNLPYDPQLEQKTKVEQLELAIRNANILRARGPLAGDDLYYLGMLYHLASDADEALKAMQLLLKDGPDGAKAQAARNVVVLYAVKKDRIPEAVAAVADYGKHQPQFPGDRYRMEFLIADAVHTRSDVFVSCSVLLGLVLIKAGYYWLDPLVSLAVAVVIAWNGYKIFKSTVPVLVDAAPVSAQQIAAIAEGVPGVHSVHDVRSRGRDGEMFIEMHMHMGPEVERDHIKTHAITEKVEQRLADALGHVMVTIHVEPLPQSKKS